MSKTTAQTAFRYCLSPMFPTLCTLQTSLEMESCPKPAAACRGPPFQLARRMGLPAKKSDLQVSRKGLQSQAKPSRCLAGHPAQGEVHSAAQSASKTEPWQSGVG